ncbi:MAG: TolC family protein [Deltaproteobacteria bacterium]|nr:TolC family protein [Deltaproteobacteria bacterium]
MRNASAFIVLCLFLTHGSAWADDVAASRAASRELTAPRLVDGKERSIGLDEVRGLVERSFEVRRARARASVGSGQATEAVWRIFPTVSGQLGLTRVDGATQSSSTGELDSALYTTASPYARLSYGANAAEAIYGAISAARRESALEKGVESARRLFSERTADQFYDLVQAHENVRVAELAVREAAELLRIAEVLDRQGQARGDDAARARSELAGAEQNHLRAVRTHHQASIRLATSVDLEPSELLIPRSETKERDGAQEESEESLLARALAERPEIAEAQARSRATDAERGAAWAGLVAPTLELYYQEGGLGLDYTALEHRRTYGALVTWNLSGVAVAKIGTSGARIEETELDVEQAKRNVAAEVTSAFDDFRLARARLEPAARTLESAEETLRISNVRFKNGSAILLEVIQAQRAVELARLSRVSAVVEHDRARTRLEVVVSR